MKEINTYFCPRKAFNSEDEPKTRATPEDLIRVTTPITMASAKAVSAGRSLKQDDVIAAANLGRKAVSDMLMTCKVCFKRALKELFPVYSSRCSRASPLLLTG